MENGRAQVRILACFFCFFFFCVCVCVSGRVCSFSAHSRKGSYFSKINGLIFDEANRRY